METVSLITVPKLSCRLQRSHQWTDTVLAIEYGYLDSSPEITLTGPGSRIVGINSGLGSGSRFYNLSSEPLEGTSGSRYQVSAGCIVGGSSAVNGMIFDRGSAEDYDAWVWAAGDQHKEAYGKEWGWKNLLPWFKKSVTFHPPSDEMVKQYGMTYDAEAAYGGNTPIHSSYPPYQWPAHREYLLALCHSKLSASRERVSRVLMIRDFRKDI